MQISNHILWACILSLSLASPGCSKQSEMSRQQIEIIMNTDLIGKKDIQEYETRHHYFVLQNFLENILTDLGKDPSHPDGRILDYELSFQNILMSFESGAKSESRSPTGAKWLFQNVNIDEDIGSGRPGKYRQRLKNISPEHLKLLPKEVRSEIQKIQKEPLGNTPMKELASLLKKYEDDPFVNSFMALLYQSVLTEVLGKKEQSYEQKNQIIQLFQEDPIEKQINILEEESEKLLQNTEGVNSLLLRTISRPYPKSKIRSIDRDSFRAFFAFLRQNPKFAKSVLALIYYNGGTSSISSYGEIEERYLEAIIVGYLTFAQVVQKHPDSGSGFEK